MKYIKKLKSFKDSPRVGDYVIVSSRHSDIPEYEDDEEFGDRDIAIFNKFVNSTIGILIKYKLGDGFVLIKYDNVPEIIKDWFSSDNTREFDIDEVIAWSKKRDDIEIILASKTYNI